MTPPAVNLATDPRDGCTFPGCETQQTETLDSYHGRRCADHPPRFDPATAVTVATTDLGAAADYIRAMFPEEAS